MRPSKEMRERAQPLVDAICDYIGDNPDDNMRFDVSSDICAFAQAEVSRAVQECIEAICHADCGAHDGVSLNRHESGEWVHRWNHNGHEYGCYAGRARELLYQQQLASEGEEK